MRCWPWARASERPLANSHFFILNSSFCIHQMNLPRSLSRNLNDALLREQHKMMRERRIYIEVSGVKPTRGAFIDRVSESDSHFAAEDRHALGTRVPVRRNLRAGREAEAHGEHAGGFWL